MASDLPSGATFSRWSKIVGFVERGFGHVEFGLDLLEGRFGHVGMFVEHGHEVALLDHADAVDGLGRRRVHALQLRAVGRRAEELGVQHAGQADVGRVFRLAGHLVAAVAAFHRLADNVKIGDGPASAAFCFRCRSIFFPWANSA